MRPLLEDLVIGPSASPSFTTGYRWEDAQRRLRVVFSGQTIAESHHVQLLHEFGRLPVYYFPRADVDVTAWEVSDLHTDSPLKGRASYWHVRAGDRMAENAAWTYPQPANDAPPLAEYLAFYWDKMDAWYAEAEQLFAHARDPYKWIETLPSTRHVQVVLNGQTIADTHRPVLVLETGLPIRQYIHRDDIQMDALARSSTVTWCAYKGAAAHLSATIDGHEVADIAWTYPTPLAPTAAIADLVCFYNERVDAIIVDGAMLARPTTQWSSGALMPSPPAS